MTEAAEARKCPPVQIIRGLPFPVGLFKRETIEECLDYVPRDNDIILASYPKTGSTWLQYIVLQIFSKGAHFPSFNDVTYKIVPYIEMAGVKVLDDMKEPRMYKHHIPFNMVKKNEKSKVLYSYRHPEDTFVSFYHFSQSLSPVPIHFGQFFENFMTGNVGYGRYFEHVLSFYDHKNDANLLMISYEKMQADRRQGILDIAKFLGEEHYQQLMEDDAMMEKVLEHTSFEYMKKNLRLEIPKIDPADEGTRSINFFRKGVVGDGKNELSAEQRQRIKEAAEKVLEGTEILKEWYND